MRLTESDLHRIIENSVRRTINELNHDTVSSAYRKMKDSGRMPQAKNISKIYNDSPTYQPETPGYSSHLSINVNHPRLTRDADNKSWFSDSKEDQIAFSKENKQSDPKLARSLARDAQKLGFKTDHHNLRK